MEYIVLIFARRITICLYINFEVVNFFYSTSADRPAGQQTAGRGRLASDCTMARTCTM